jgi:hypothetical protein
MRLLIHFISRQLFVSLSLFMKWRILFLVALLLSMAACVSRSTREALNIAEGLVSGNPQESLAILDSISRESLSTRPARARHALLTTMAQDKCYMDVAEDSTIRVAFDWYLDRGSKANRLKSYYYLGVVKQNAGNDIDAAICFREAESLAEELKDYRFLSLCSQHLNAVHSHHFDRVTAMSYAEKSLKAAEKAGDTLMAAYCRLDIADQYIAKFEFDLAEDILTDLVHQYQASSSLSAYACRSLAKLYLLKPKPEYEKAGEYYEKVVSANAIALSSQDYGYLGLLAESRGEIASSNRYCSIAEQSIKTAADSVTFYMTKTNIYDLRGDYRESSVSYGKAMEIQDRIVYAQMEQSITHAMENYYQTQAALEHEKGRSRLYIAIICGFLLLGVIVWLTGRLRRTKREVLEKMAEIQDFNEELERLQSKDFASCQLLDYYAKDKIQSLKHLANAYFSWDSDRVRQKEKRYGDKTKDELIEDFQKQFEDFRKNDNLYTSLEQALNMSDNGIMDRAKTMLGPGKKEDYELLLLFLYGFSAKSICFLKNGLTEASVRMRKSRIKQFFASLPDEQGREFVKKLEREG